MTTVAALVFDDFELLDFFGPLELLGSMPEQFEVSVVGPALAPVRSRQGARCLPDFTWDDAGPCDILLVPGGLGTRSLARDEMFLKTLQGLADEAGIVASVCTGAGLLAASGLLDGYRATSNKLAFGWVVEQGPRVDWVRSARWVHDRDRWTSSGVAAGMDMTLALIAELYGLDAAQQVANYVELEWHQDSSWDPYAKLHGLV